MSDNAIIPDPRATALIDEIMDNFAFGKVAKMMKAVGWVWMGYEPVVEERSLREEARRLLRQAVSSDSGYVSTGGFTARRECGCLTLSWGEEWTAGEGE